MPRTSRHSNSSSQSVTPNSSSRNFAKTTQPSGSTTPSTTQASSNPSITTCSTASTSAQFSGSQRNSSGVSGGMNGMLRNRIMENNNKTIQGLRSTTASTTQSSSSPTVTTRTPATTPTQISGLRNNSSGVSVPAHAEPSTSKSTVPDYAVPSTSKSGDKNSSASKKLPRTNINKKGYSKENHDKNSSASKELSKAKNKKYPKKSNGRKSNSKNHKKRKAKKNICPAIKKAILSTTGVLSSDEMCSFINQFRRRRIKNQLKVVYKFTRNIPALMSQVLDIEKTFYKRIRRNKKISSDEDLDIRYIETIPGKLRNLIEPAADVVLPEEATIVEDSTKEEAIYHVTKEKDTILMKEIYKL